MACPATKTAHRRVPNPIRCHALSSESARCLVHFLLPLLSKERIGVRFPVFYAPPTSTQQSRILVKRLQHEFAENGVCPGEP